MRLQDHDTMTPPSNEMPAWIFEAIQNIHREMTAQHDLLRRDVNTGFEGLRQEMRVQNGRVGQAETRVTVIETQRGEEEKQAIKHGAWAGVIAAGGLTVAIEVFRMWMRKH